MSSGAKVTVIVPAYNVEQYIERCVVSIQRQSYSNIELIIVDDGSTDRTPQIIDSLKGNDDRICVVHKENAGVSSARNLGLEKAGGEYIIFVDGDDHLEEDCVSYFVELIDKFDCDIAVGKRFYTVWNQNQVSEDNQAAVDSLQIVEDIYLSKIREAVWNKIYKKAFLAKHNIQFDRDIWFGEGMLFNIKCLQHADKVAVGERKVYHQTYNPDSAMRNFNLESNYCGIRSLYEQKKYWKESNERIESAWIYHHRCFFLSILRGLIKTKQVKKHKNVYKVCIKNLKKNIDVPLKVNISIGLKIMFLAMCVSPVLVTRAIVCRDKMANKKARVLLNRG